MLAKVVFTADPTSIANYVSDVVVERRLVTHN